MLLTLLVLLLMRTTDGLAHAIPSRTTAQARMTYTTTSSCVPAPSSRDHAHTRTCHARTNGRTAEGVLLMRRRDVLRNRDRHAGICDPTRPPSVDNSNLRTRRVYRRNHCPRRRRTRGSRRGSGSRAVLISTVVWWGRYSGRLVWSPASGRCNRVPGRLEALRGYASRRDTNPVRIGVSHAPSHPCRLMQRISRLRVMVPDSLASRQPRRRRGGITLGRPARGSSLRWTGPSILVRDA